MSISSAFAVSMMIGTELFARSRRQTSSPSTFGQHDVEHHQVELLAVEVAASASWPSTRGHDLVALLLERIAEQLLDRLLVVHQQYPRGAALRRVVRPAVDITCHEVILGSASVLIRRSPGTSCDP